VKKSFHQVSDHAVLRYLERAHGINVEGVRHEIGQRIDTAVERMVFTDGPVDCSAAHIDGLTFVLKERTVVTVLDRKTSNKARPE